MSWNGCLVSLVSIFRRQGSSAPPAEEGLPYRLRDDMLSPAEVSFYHILRYHVGDRAVLCPKVNLADVIFVRHPDLRKQVTYRNRIDRKHLDFLLCDPGSMRPIGAVELDDRSHHSASRQERDALVVRVLQAAGLPLVRVPVQRSYTVSEVQQVIATILTPHGRQGGTARGAQGAAPSENPGTTDAAAPICPRCGAAMAVRTGRSGQHSGRQFWGCTEYPRCHGVRSMARQEGQP